MGKPPDRGTTPRHLETDDTLIEIRSGVNATRNLRDGLVNLADALQKEPKRKRALLVIKSSRISPRRLQQEWELIERVFRPQITARLAVALLSSDGIHTFPRDLDPSLRMQLELSLKNPEPADKRLPRSGWFPEIFKVLLYQRFTGSGSMTSQWLSNVVGCTYPTVAHALRELGPALIRTSDRRFKLAYFPQQAWTALLANSHHSRHTMYFADRSGKPTSIEAMIRRLTRLGRTDIAVGGVAGARHYCRNLDLIGTPRLDLTVHIPHGRLDTDFVQDLGTALQLTDNSPELAVLAIHVLRRKEPFFSIASDHIPYADPVECLLDLAELRLQSQAVEFLEFLEQQRKPDR